MKHLTEMVRQHKAGKTNAIYAVCSAHPLVLEAAIRYASANQTPLLIEATSNQVDQFGGLNEKENVLKAYEIGVKEHGEAFMKQRFQDSARRLLKNIFRTGLFENPYLELQKSLDTVGNPEFVKKGFDSQLHSVVLLKNRNQALPLKEKVKGVH